MANVFVSHRGTDIIEAARLAAAIKAAGHSVWLDEWEIGLGDSIVGRIDSGLEGARYLVLCYSSSGIDTPWMTREWHSTLARQLNGHDVKILPVRLTGGQPPPIMTDVKYADLVSNWSKGVSELLRALR